MNREPRSISRMARVMPVEGIGAGLAEDHVVGIAVGEHEPDVVQRRGQPGFADHVRRAAGALVGQKLARRQRRRPDRALGDVDPAAQQARPQIPRGEDRVVGQHQVPALVLLQGGDEVGTPGKRLLLVHQHAVHVGQPVLHRLAFGHGLHSARYARPHETCWVGSVATIALAAVLAGCADDPEPTPDPTPSPTAPPSAHGALARPRLGRQRGPRHPLPGLGRQDQDPEGEGLPPLLQSAVDCRQASTHRQNGCPAGSSSTRTSSWG